MVYWVVMKWAQKQPGFTIVELLIVVVVIAILAAITIVAYNGITNNSKASALQSELSQVSKALEAKKVAGGTDTYPSDINDVGDTSDKLTYHYNDRSNTYCIDAKDGDLEYSVRGTTLKVEEGPCIEHGLALWLPLNGNVSDASGNENGVTIQGTPTATTGADGRANGAYYFDGNNQALALQTPDSIPSRFDRFTVSAWARGVSAVSDYSYVIHKGHNNSIGTSVLFLGTNTGSSQNLIAAADGEYGAGNTGISANASTWRHLVLVYAGGVQIAYVDGVQAGADDTIGSIGNVTVGTTFMIGGGPAGYRDFTGSIDDVRVYHRALTDAEVQNLYEAGAQ